MTMTWNDFMNPVMQNPKLLQLKAFIQNERKTKNIYPSPGEVFTAYNLCTYNNTRVVIIGQDPYHTPGTAHGLAFSTLQDKRPPSLEIIFKEIYRDLNIQYFHNITFDEFFPTNNLTRWAVDNKFLLINSCLTVEEGKPGSHQGLGWELLTRAVIEGLNNRDKQIIFLLWGKQAQEYEQYVDHKKHVVFRAAHPAAELYKDNKGGYLGCRHFSIIRDILPVIHGEAVDPSICLDAAFDRGKAKEIAKELFPLDAKALSDFIDNELHVFAPLNKERYYRQLRKFEKSLSTDYEKQE